ncbi:MAG: DUF308 domain-containing protein [Prevotellaceae bacterium]|jgi:uncharacterized membrane protein HdeD (DUF308 family)|nr:DUF308 domain-containing protein [Prevotellaceae bacterium]
MSNPVKKSFFIKTDWLFLRAIICFLGGVLLWIYPDLLAKSVVIGMGVLLIVSGIVSLVISANKGRESGFFYLIISSGVLSVSGGLALILASAFFVNLFVFVVGILVILLSVIQFFEIFDMRKYAPKTSALAFLSPLLLVALGVLVIVNPQGISNLIGYFAAAALIYYGITGFVLAFGIRKALKKASQLTAWEEVDDAEHDENEQG